MYVFIFAIYKHFGSRNKGCNIYMHTYIMYVCIIGMFVCMIMSVFINILAASVCLECSTVNSVGSEV